VETRQGDAGEKETFIPLFGALNWAASIDIYFFENGSPIGDDLLTGVRFARNRVHHQWALALARYDSPGGSRRHPCDDVVTDRRASSRLLVELGSAKRPAVRKSLARR